MLGGGRLHEGRLDATLIQQPVDRDALIAEFPEFHRTINTRKGGPPGGLISKDQGGSGRRVFVHTKIIRPGFEAWNGFRRLMPLFFSPSFPLGYRLGTGST